MWQDFLVSIVAPIFVGIVLALFSKWLNGKDND
ncbi:TPA: type I toxin-antitoxin system Fst family toxin [Streptococcus agalactiae]|nr:type I toxin-antitoxin system Fst family toxin [Streptococcus agalactiae]HEN4337172.1 type I toxin-antitoxin system Fst family toxin [Streptococcus agalactiae]HEN4338381.1 type I toxin-antitoxin system Fst family toxin [Streptococcus agalactiae]HEN6441228.1 type I toxin-antitoxin system Fst family toxin [Streptococcus agalactiae]HEN7647452.1 type I toxin-antitoxin system Fst family toxin [Streptococcus agalactiae]